MTPFQALGAWNHVNKFEQKGALKAARPVRPLSARAGQDTQPEKAQRTKGR